MSGRPRRTSATRASRSDATPRRSGTTPRRSGTTPRRWLPSALTRGQRPFVFLFAALLVALATMAATPAQRYLASQERVESLTVLRDELAEDVDALEERKTRLEDPEEVELIARRELGLVRPGEISYVVVRPDDDTPRVDVREPEPEPDDDPWWRRVGAALGLLDDAGAPAGR